MLDALNPAAFSAASAPRFRWSLVAAAVLYGVSCAAIVAATMEIARPAPLDDIPVDLRAPPKAADVESPKPSEKKSQASASNTHRPRPTKTPTKEGASGSNKPSVNVIASDLPDHQGASLEEPSGALGEPIAGPVLRSEPLRPAPIIPPVRISLDQRSDRRCRT